MLIINFLSNTSCRTPNDSNIVYLKCLNKLSKMYDQRKLIIK